MLFNNSKSTVISMVKMKIAPSSGGANFGETNMGTKVTHESMYDVYCVNAQYRATNLSTGDCLHRLNRNVWSSRDGLIHDSDLVDLLETGVAEERAKQQRQHKSPRNMRPTNHRQPIPRPVFNKPREPRGNGRVE